MADPLLYRHPNPAVSSISIDGVEHKTNGDGLIEIHQVTPNTITALQNHGAVRLDANEAADHARKRRLGVQGNVETDDDRAEKDKLTGWIEKAGGKVDRRSSVKVLRERWADMKAERPELAEAEQQPPA